MATNTEVRKPPSQADDPVHHPDASGPAFPPLYRLSVEQYHRACEADIISEGTPVELVEGLLVCKMGKNPPHLMATGLTNQVLNRVLPAGWCVGREPDNARTPDERA